MNLPPRRTSFDFQVQRALGEWQTQENSLPRGEGRCPFCEKFHEEPQLVLMALSGWNCQRAAKYETEVFDRCLNGSKFPVAYRRFRRLAPYSRIGAHLGIESDADYLHRVYELKKRRVNWDQLLHDDALADVKTHNSLQLPKYLWDKANEIKCKYPVAMARKRSLQRRRKLRTGSESLSVRTNKTRRDIPKASSGSDG